MNTPVSFEIKQLLYDKGWRYELGLDETGYRVEHSLAEQKWNEGNLTYVDITISEVVMWLYDKHGIWIHPKTSFKIINDEALDSFTPVIERRTEFDINNLGEFNSPTESYEAAIEYTLNNLI